MSFIRQRGRRKPFPRYQLVQSYREDGKVKQRIASLGAYPSVEEALARFQRKRLDSPSSAALCATFSRCALTAGLPVGPSHQKVVHLHQFLMHLHQTLSANLLQWCFDSTP